MPDLEPDEFRRPGHPLVDWVAQYRTSLPSLRVRPNVLPGSVKAQLPRELPEHPSEALGDDLVALLNDVVVPSSLHWQRPGFFGYFPGERLAAVAPW